MFHAPGRGTRRVPGAVGVELVGGKPARAGTKALGGKALSAGGAALGTGAGLGLAVAGGGRRRGPRGPEREGTAATMPRPILTDADSFESTSLRSDR